MLYIAKDITIQAQNPGQAILDGQGARRVIFIDGGVNVVLDGLSITGGQAWVRLPSHTQMGARRAWDSSSRPPNGSTSPSSMLPPPSALSRLRSSVAPPHMAVAALDGKNVRASARLAVRLCLGVSMRLPSSNAITLMCKP